MFDNNKKVVSGIVALTGTLVTPETAQATWNRSDLRCLIKTNRKSSGEEETANALNKVKSTKKAFDNVKTEAEKAINKAKNIKHDALIKVNQAEEILKATKEDWETKVITATKKIQELESNPEKIYLTKQVHQAKQNADKARENFENKKSQAAKKRLQFQQCQQKLEAISQEENNKIEAAEIAYKQAQIEQQKVIQRANNSSFGWDNWTQKQPMKIIYSK